MIFSLVLYIIAIFSGFIFRSSKKNTVFMYIVMVSLAAFRADGFDLGGYKYEYNHVFEAYNSARRYVGYKYFVQFFNSKGFNFETYLFLFFCIVFALLVFGISRLTERINSVLALYMIFPFGLDVTQMKTLISETVAFIGIIAIIVAEQESISLRKKKGMIATFVLLEGIAFTMHFSSFFFLVAGVLYLTVRKRKSLKGWIIVGILIILPLLYVGFTGWLLQNAIELELIGSYDSVYMEQYFDVATRFGSIIPVTWTLLMIYAVFHLGMRCNYASFDVRLYEVDELMKTFVITSAMLMPFFVVNIYFSRLLRVYMLLVYIMLANMPKLKHSPSTIRLTKGIVAFGLAFIIANWMEGSIAVICDVLKNAFSL